jgi:hypothetical protein
MKRQAAAGAFMLIVGMPGNGATEAQEPQPIVIQAPHPADQCQEDEDWATVHYQTPGAYDMNNGTRQCVNREGLVMAGINELILDGTLIWEWDL